MLSCTRWCIRTDHSLFLFLMRLINCTWFVFANGNYRSTRLGSCSRTLGSWTCKSRSVQWHALNNGYGNETKTSLDLLRRGWELVPVRKVSGKRDMKAELFWLKPWVYSNANPQLGNIVSLLQMSGVPFFWWCTFAFLIICSCRMELRHFTALSLGPC